MELLVLQRVLLVIGQLVVLFKKNSGETSCVTKITTSFLLNFTQSIRKWSFQSVISSVTHLCCLLQVSLILRSMTFQFSIKFATYEKIASTTCLINEVRHLFKLIFGHIAAPFLQHCYEQTAKDQYSDQD